MAVWRIISRSYLKYASYQLARNYSQLRLVSSLNHAVKQTQLSSLDILNSDICTRPSHIFHYVRFLATSAQTRKKGEDDKSNGPRLNDKITAEFVRLVSEDGHCVVSLREALRRAKELESDLVEVQRDAKPPVCKIVEYKKEKYQKEKVGKERAKAKRAETVIRPDVKEIRFTPKIEEKDIQIKANQALRLMESGYRVKLNAVPEKDKKKELEPEKLLELLSRFTCHIGDALLEFGPEASRTSAVVVVRHAKFGPPKKGRAIKLKDMNINTAARILAPNEESGKTDSAEASVSTVDDQGDIKKPEPELRAKQAQPVQPHNRYAKREPTSEFSGGRDAKRFEPLNPQRPPFPNQAPKQQPTGRFDPQSPGAPLSRFPNQQPTGRFDPQSPNQLPGAPLSWFPNQQPTGRFDPQSPKHPPSPPRPRFPDQAPNQQPAGRFESRPQNQPPSPPHLPFANQAPNQQPAMPSPNRHLERQGPPPRFQNQDPNQQPTGRFEPPSRNPPRTPPRPPTRLPNETSNQQPTDPGTSSGPASSYGIFSTPKTK